MKPCLSLMKRPVSFLCFAFFSLTSCKNANSQNASEEDARERAEEIVSGKIPDGENAASMILTEALLKTVFPTAAEIEKTCAVYTHPNVRYNFTFEGKNMGCGLTAAPGEGSQRSLEHLKKVLKMEKHDLAGVGEGALYFPKMSQISFFSGKDLYHVNASGGADAAANKTLMIKLAHAIIAKK